MIRKTPLTNRSALGRHVRLQPQSRKRRRQQQARRDMHVPEGERCRLAIPGVCTGAAECWHELVGAGVGGSRVDARNTCPSCARCNQELEGRSDRYAMGWKVRSSDAKPGYGGLVPAVPHPLAWASPRPDGLESGMCSCGCGER